MRLRLLIAAAALSALGLADAAWSQEKTDIGTPRKETLVVDILSGRVGNPRRMNPVLGGQYRRPGLHQLAYSNLWDIDTVKACSIRQLAATMPEALDATFTKWRFKVRKGLAWSDGAPFSSADVVFTARMALDNPKLPYNRFIAANIKDIRATDDETVEIDTVNPLPKITYSFGAVIFGNAFRVVPKHIWEKVDPLTFENYPPVTIGPYKLKDSDPNGYWFLWEKRDDWQRTDVGQIVGEPKPKYVLFRSYGPEEKRIIAMAQNRARYPDRYHAGRAGDRAHAQPQGEGLVRSLPVGQPRRSRANAASRSTPRSRPTTSGRCAGRWPWRPRSTTSASPPSPACCAPRRSTCRRSRSW
jgi:peptide/nickel transport system substrate-binding protein